MTDATVDDARGKDCPTCGKAFEDDDELRRHVTTHEDLARPADDDALPILPQTGGEQAEGGTGRIQTE